MEPNFLLSSVEAAKEVAYMLRGEWDECNGVQFVERDIEALKAAAKLCYAEYCEVGNDCNLREEKSLAQFHQLMKKWMATPKFAIPFTPKIPIPFSYTLEDNCRVRLMYRDPEIIVNIYYRPVTIYYMSEVKGTYPDLTYVINYVNNQTKPIEHRRYRFPKLLKELKKYFSSLYL